MRSLRLVGLVLPLVLVLPVVARGEGDLLLATTTSVNDSGLLDFLIPLFEEETGIVVRPVVVGSGAALRMGALGNVDAVLTHAPPAEMELVASGAAASRLPFMVNWFVIAGPEEDPVGVSEASSVIEAVHLIRRAEGLWVSRGDDSGTHRRERALLAEAGLEENGDWPGFISTGSGMGLSLQVAGERGAYVLADVGTFLAFRERTGLRALYQREEALLRNEYSLLRVSSDRFPKVQASAAAAFENFLCSRGTQRRLATFGVERFGRPLFRPLYPKSCARGR